MTILNSKVTILLYDYYKKILYFLVGSADDSYHDDFCCPPVVDSSTWLGVVGGMAVVTFFLRMAITMNIMPGRRKRNIQPDQDEHNDVITKGQLCCNAQFFSLDILVFTLHNK